MTRLAPETVHPDARFFLDFVADHGAAPSFFEHTPSEMWDLAQTRSIDSDTRQSVCNALEGYNRELGAGPDALTQIDRLRRADAFCVLGGQQAGFLGGPQFVVYKIASIIQLAKRYERLLDRPVVPMFWLASEDHDFQEINRVRVVDKSGTLRTTSFKWEGEGQPIERLQIGPQIHSALAKATEWMEPLDEELLDLFTPHADEDYCRWHARIWSTVFASSGLVLVEPRVLRPMAAPFFSKAIAARELIQSDLHSRAASLSEEGYSALLDPETAGSLFRFDAAGQRKRLDGPPSTEALDPMSYSPDAALRPVLADALLPNLAHIVGPSELTYHAMLQPVYHRFDITQPLVVPRFGATVLRASETQLLDAFEVQIESLLDPNFKAQDQAMHKASPELQQMFDQARRDLEKAMEPLAVPLESLDPGLTARLRQTTDQLQHQLGRLEERTLRVELGQEGLSVRELQRIAELVFPGEQLQERGLSFFHFAASYGVQWIKKLGQLEADDAFHHDVISL